MKEVFKEPSAKDCDGGLRQSSDWSPSLALTLHHPKLLKSDSVVIVAVISGLSVEQAKLRQTSADLGQVLKQLSLLDIYPRNNGVS